MSSKLAKFIKFQPVATPVAAPEVAQPASTRPSKQRKLNSRAKVATEPAPPAAVDSDDDPAQDDAGPPDDAYTSLLGVLSSTRASYAHAIRTKRKEQEGDSDLDSGQSQDDSDDDGDTEGEESSDGSGHDDAALGKGSAKPAPLATASNGNEATVTVGTDHDDDAGDGGSSADEADTQPAAASSQLGGGDGKPGAVATQPGGLAAACDFWESHFGRELTPDEVAALGAGSAKLKYAEALLPQPSAAAWPPGRWQTTADALPAAPPSLAEYGVKERLRTRWTEVQQEEAAAKQQQRQEQDAERRASHAAAGSSRGRGRSDGDAMPDGDFTSSQQRAFFSMCNSYQDVFYDARTYPSSVEETDGITDAYLLHCLNHCAKAADRIKRNNERLKAAAAADAAARAAAKQGINTTNSSTPRVAVAGSAAPSVPEDVAAAPPRDQGFTRPKVLLLLPMRNASFRVVVRLVQLAMRETRADSVQGKEKFVEQFTDPEGEEDVSEAAAARRSLKPADFRALFSGNMDDHFRLGIKLTRGAIRLFVDFYQADIIVASPIALATKLAEDRREAAAAGGSSKGRGGAAGAVEPAGEADFLSSVEVVVVDRADVMCMQNWEHVQTVFEALNRLPRSQHGVDIMRVRHWALAGHAGHYRQTLLLSSFANADMNSLFSRACSNHAGKLRFKQEHRGVLARVVPQVQQLFERVPCPSPAASSTARFDYFCGTLWPRLRDAGAAGTLLFVPHYFDFVRLRNFLAAQDASCGALCEYTSGSDATRARAHFFHGRRRILMYTERAHFYHRHRLRGIKDVLFYSLPEHAHYFVELVNLLEEGGAAAGGGGHGTVTVLFNKYDALQLERVVGASRAKKMISSAPNTYMFC